MQFEMYKPRETSELGRFREWFEVCIGGNAQTLGVRLEELEARVEVAGGPFSFVKDSFKELRAGVYDANEVVEKMLHLLTCEDNRLDYNR